MTIIVDHCQEECLGGDMTMFAEGFVNSLLRVSRRPFVAVIGR